MVLVAVGVGLLEVGNFSHDSNTMADNDGCRRARREQFCEYGSQRSCSIWTRTPTCFLSSTLLTDNPQRSK